MKVTQYAAFLSADTFSVYQHTKNEKLRFWDDRLKAQPAETNPSNLPDQGIKDEVDLRNGFQSVSNRTQGSATSGANLLSGPDEDPSLTGKLRIIKELLEKMTGKRIRLLTLHEKAGNNDPQGTADQVQTGANAQSQRQGWGLEYTYFEETFFREGVRFSAQGNIYTAEGGVFRFDVALEMSRQRYESTQLTIKAGDALLDPLVVNLDGKGVELGEKTYGFDLNADAVKENIRFLKPGSGFLALDENANGRIDDGGELFGPRSGNGFNELAGYDRDQNGWIDENDPVFYQLRIWEKDGQDRDVISTLAQKNIGAIFLGKAATDFVLADSQSSLAGQLKETGLYLRENGEVGFVQEIDLMI